MCNQTNKYIFNFNVQSFLNNYKNIISHIPKGDPFEKKALFVYGEKSEYVKKENI
jgi:hypothetical protein